MSKDKEPAQSPSQMPNLSMQPAKSAQSGCAQCDKSGFPLCLCKGENSNAANEAEANKQPGWDADIDDPLVPRPKPLLVDDPDKLQFAEQVKKQFDTFMQDVATQQNRTVPELKGEGNRCELSQHGVQLSIPSPELRAQFFDSLQTTGIAKPAGVDPLMAGQGQGAALGGYQSPTPFAMEPKLKPPGSD